MKSLTAIDKVKMWHDGTRKLNVGACSDDKLQKYSSICSELGYTKEFQNLQDELSRRKKKSTDLLSLTPEERLKILMDACGLTKFDLDVYIYPKTKKGWDTIKKAFADSYEMDSAEKARRLSEWEWYKEDFGGEFGFLSDDGILTMELAFSCPDFLDLPVEMQVACCEIEWDKD